MSHRSTRWIASQVGWAIILAGIGMAQWDEYGVALILFELGSIILFLKAYHWIGIEGWPRSSRLLKLSFLVSTFVMILVSYPVTIARKESKPWSATFSLWERTQQMLTMDTSPRKPPPPPLILEKKMPFPMKIKPQSPEAINLLTGVSDERLKGISFETIKHLQQNWSHFWDDDDLMLDQKKNLAKTPEEWKKIGRQQDKLRVKLWRDNEPLLSKAIATRDECCKRPALTQECNDLKNAISKFFDMQDSMLSHH
jgi:hypothetical protein